MQKTFLDTLMWIFESASPVAAFLIVLNEEFSFLHEHPDDSSLMTSVIVMLLVLINYRIGVIVESVKSKEEK